MSTFVSSSATSMVLYFLAVTHQIDPQLVSIDPRFKRETIFRAASARSPKGMAPIAKELV